MLLRTWQFQVLFKDLPTCLPLEQQGCFLQVYLFLIQWTVRRNTCIPGQSITNMDSFHNYPSFPSLFRGPLWDFHISTGSKILESKSISPTCLPINLPHLWGQVFPVQRLGNSILSFWTHWGQLLLYTSQGTYGLWTVGGFVGGWCCCHCKRRSRGMVSYWCWQGKSCWHEMTDTCCSCDCHNLLGPQEFMELQTNYLSITKSDITWVLCLPALTGRKVLGFLNHQVYPDPEFHVDKFLMKLIAKAYLFVDNVFIEDRAGSLSMNPWDKTPGCFVRIEVVSR